MSFPISVRDSLQGVRINAIRLIINAKLRIYCIVYARQGKRGSWIIKQVEFIWKILLERFYCFLVNEKIFTLSKVMGSVTPMSLELQKNRHFIHAFYTLNRKSRKTALFETFMPFWRHMLKTKRAARDMIFS